MEVGAALNSVKCESHPEVSGIRRVEYTRLTWVWRDAPEKPSKKIGNDQALSVKHHIPQNQKINISETHILTVLPSSLKIIASAPQLPVNI